MSDAQQTQPLPDPRAQWVLSASDEPRPRRRAWPWLVGLLLVVALAVGAWFVGEWIARDIVTKTIRQGAITQLSLPADQQIDVDIEGAVLPQLIAGTLDDVTVASDDVTFGALSGDVVVRAQGVPVRGDAAARSATATIQLDTPELQTLLEQIPDFPAATVGLFEPNVTASTELQLFGAGIPIGITLTPGVADGDITLSPVSLKLAGAELTASDLTERFGDLAGVVVRDYDVCIREYVPAGVTLTGIRVSGDRVIADLDIDGAIITDPALQANGTCA
nr:DUF2993 domain-containing protein [Microbacterium lemovicicum]